MRRKRMPNATTEELASAPAPVAQDARATPLAEQAAPPHPSLIELVRLLARQAATAEIAAQRAAQKPED